MVSAVGRPWFHRCVVALSIALVGCTSSAPQNGAGGGRAGGDAGAPGGKGGDGSVAGGSGFNGTGGSTPSGGGGASPPLGVGGGGGSAIAGAGGTAPATGAAGAAGAAGAHASCPPVGSRIDVPATPVSGKVTINGAHVGDDNTNGAIVALTRSGPSAFLDDQALLPFDTNGAYSTLVMPGTYEVRYLSRQFAEPGAPTNMGANYGGVTLRRGVVVGTSPLSLDVDVPAATVSLTATVAGKALTKAVYNGDGAFSLVSADGDSALLTGKDTAKGAYTALVIPGTYDLVYAGYTSGAGMPVNTAARIQTGIVLGTSPVSLKADLTATKVSIALTAGGTAVAATTDFAIDLTLRTVAGDLVTLARDTTTVNTFSALVVPGTYDLYYGAPNANARAPQSAKVKSGIVVGATPISLAVDVPGTPVSSKATINDLPLASTMGLYLQNAAGLTFGLRNDGTSAPVTPGTYDLYFNQGSLTGSAPMNKTTRIKTGIVVADAPVNLDLEIPVATLSGKITLNGATLSDPKMSDGDLFLADDTGGSVRLTRVTAGTYSTLVIAGTYDLYFKVTSDNLGVPANSYGLVKKGIVVGVSSTPIALDLDIPFVAVASTVTVNGAPLPSTDNNRGIIEFYGDHGDIALVVPVTSSTVAISVPVIPGVYELYYHLYGGAAVPINGLGYLGCATVR
jgi:hypothetical protein